MTTRSITARAHGVSRAAPGSGDHDRSLAAHGIYTHVRTGRDQASLRPCRHGPAANLASYACSDRSRPMRARPWPGRRPARSSTRPPCRRRSCRPVAGELHARGQATDNRAAHRGCVHVVDTACGLRLDCAHASLAPSPRDRPTLDHDTAGHLRRVRRKSDRARVREAKACPRRRLEQAAVTNAKEANTVAPEVATIRGRRVRPRRTISSTAPTAPATPTAPTAPTSAVEPADRCAGGPRAT